MEIEEFEGKRFKIYNSGSFEGTATVIKVMVPFNDLYGSYCNVRFDDELDRTYYRWVRLDHKIGDNDGKEN